MKHTLVVLALFVLACGDDSPSSTTNNTLTNNNTQNSTTNNTATNTSTNNSSTNNVSNSQSNNTTNNQTNNPTNNTTNNQTNNQTNNPTNNMPGGLFVSTSDPYLMGPLATQTIQLAAGDNGAPRIIRVVAPTAPGTYAVIAFHHGFVLRAAYYADTLEHLASHGFIVVAPQMGTSAFNAPTVEEEADDVEDVYAWMQTSLATVTGVTPSFDDFGVAGHSRGAKVAWTILRRDTTLYKAIAGIDPVDGTGGPLGGQPRVADTPFPVSLPTFVIGTGLGPTGFQACAPDGDNYEEFYAASITATLVLAEAYGHNDMIDEGANCTACLLCAQGPNDGGLRKVTRGMSTAFFRSALQGRASDYDVLVDETAAGIDITTERK